MAVKKQWYRYTDEASRSWRIKVKPGLADVGGLEPCEESSYRHLPDTVEPRYIWIIESQRPTDRLPARHKVILERGRFQVHLKADATQ